MGPLFSFQIVSRGEPSLSDCLKSISAQSDRDFEVTLVTTEASTREAIGALPFEVNSVLVDRKTRLLEARRIANVSSSGEWAILLDARRILMPNFAASLRSMHTSADLVVIPERGRYTTRWGSVGALDKDIVNRRSNLRDSLSRREPVILPRCFRRTLLSAAFRKLERDLGEALMKQVVYGDHYLLYLASLAEEPRMAVDWDSTILHLEEADFKETIMKYFAYGRSQTVLKRQDAYPAARTPRMSPRTIEGVSTGDAVALAFLYALRSASFACGYLLPDWRTRGG